jgi:hypothetical protein
MLESKIEKDSLKEAARHGWWGIKLVPTFVRGLPDRMYLGHGQVVFIEYKTAKGKRSPMQIRIHAKFLKFGIVVHVCRSKEETMEVLNAKT